MNPPRPILRVLPNYTHGFCRWIGSPLSASHKAIIRQIERARQTATILTPARVIVEDPDPATSGIPRLLALYLQWLTTRILPHRHAVALDATVCHSVLSRSRTVGYDLFTARNPDRLRAHSFDIAILLNAHAYPRRHGATQRMDGEGFYCHATDRFADALRAILPALGPHPETLLIIHGKPRRRRDHFQLLLRRTRSKLTPYLLVLPHLNEDTGTSEMCRVLDHRHALRACPAARHPRQDTGTSEACRNPVLPQKTFLPRAKPMRAAVAPAA